jgi:hypothetical protein
MVESTENPSTKELLDRIVLLESCAELASKHIIELNDQIGKVFSFYEQLLKSVETLQLQRVADFHNAQIEEKLRQYEEVHGSSFDSERYATDDVYRRVIDEERRKKAGKTELSDAAG